MKRYIFEFSEVDANAIWKALMEKKAGEVFTTLRDMERQLAAQGAFDPPETPEQAKARVEKEIAITKAPVTPPTPVPNDPATHPDTFVDTTEKSA